MHPALTQIKALLADRAALWAAAVFFVAAVLSLWNLGQAPLWHDEATPAFMGENLWRNHTFSAWNGHTLYVGENGTAANSDLILASFPLWPTFPSALGIGLFGANEFGVRIFHTLLGLASLILFWKLLRLDFAAQPRLRVLAFTLFALGAQTILFFRFGRYVADAFFFTFLTFYAYRLYIAPGGKLWHLALAAIATVLNFLNQFGIGAAFALALAAWHCAYHFRSTTLRQWIAFAVAAAATAALCLAYLVAMGIIGGDEVLEFSEREYNLPFVPRKLLLIFQNFRELLWLGILPLWVALWFVWMAAERLYLNYLDWKGAKEEAQEQEQAPAQATAAPRTLAASVTGNVHLFRWSMLLILFLVFAGIVSVRPPTIHELANSRYIAPAFAFTALITAALIDWLWQQQWAERIVALPLLAIALCTNILAYPYIFPNLATKSKFQLRLPVLVSEVQIAPYQNATHEALEYLRAHAKKGEAIFVSPWQDFTIMQFYLADQLTFCCALDENATLPEEKVRQLGAPMYQYDIKPDWVVTDQLLPANTPYEVVFTSTTVPYPTHRPELEFRTFAPFAFPGEHLYIYRHKQP